MLDQKIEDFSFEATQGLHAKLSDYRGKWLVLYFYPKDSTPGCTLEGRAFRDAYPEFQKHNAEIFGISRDSLQSHERFQCKQEFPFPLISDSKDELCHSFDVIGTKSFFGMKFQGIQRSTFIIDPQGVLRKEWRKVKVTGHVQEVLSWLQTHTKTML